jgi:uncharacterized membrane protein
MESLPYILTNHPVVTNIITQNNTYPKLYNPKTELIKYIFGPLIDFLSYYKISAGWFFFIIIAILIYFTDYRAYKRNKELSIKPINSVSIIRSVLLVIIMFIFALITQIIMCSQVSK